MQPLMPCSTVVSNGVDNVWVQKMEPSPIAQQEACCGRLRGIHVDVSSSSPASMLIEHQQRGLIGFPSPIHSKHKDELRKEILESEHCRESIIRVPAFQSVCQP